jgi:hypothetical protein
MEPLPPGLRYAIRDVQEDANGELQLSLEVVKDSAFSESESKAESESDTDLEEDAKEQDADKEEALLVEADFWMADYEDYDDVYADPNFVDELVKFPGDDPPLMGD